MCGENLRGATSGIFAKLGHFLSSGLRGECGVMSKQAPHLAAKTAQGVLVPGVAGSGNTVIQLVPQQDFNGASSLSEV